MNAPSTRADAKRAIVAFPIVRPPIARIVLAGPQQCVAAVFPIVEDDHHRCGTIEARACAGDVHAIDESVELQGVVAIHHVGAQRAVVDPALLLRGKGCYIRAGQDAMLLPSG